METRRIGARPTARRRIIVRVLGLATLAAAAFSGPAGLAAEPEKAARPSASETFSFCREQESVGDAIACWKVWLSKYRSTGSEAEVAFAEEHSRPRMHAVLKIQGPAGASVTLDGQALGVLPLQTVVTASAGEHVIELVDGPRRTSRTLNVTGTDTVVDVNLVFEGTPADASAGAASPTEHDPAHARPGSAPASSPPRGAVLDLCALTPSADSTKFQKQRVVQLAISGVEQLERDAEVARSAPSRLFRDVFGARFPLARFHNVVIGVPGKSGWESADSIPIAEVEALLADGPVPAGDARAERLEREKKFARYSLRCTDYVVFPALTSHETKWEDRKVKTSSGERTVRSLSLVVSGALGIFKRDGATLRKVAVISATVPGIADVASDMAAMTAAAATNVRVGGADLVDLAGAAAAMPKHVSAVPDPLCFADKVATEGTAGLSACTGQGDGTVEQALGSVDERLGPVCRKAMSTGDADAMVTCEVRARAFQLARGLQKEARSVPGWKLFGVLAARADRLGVNLGADEGVRVGYGFEIRDARGERVGYFKVTSVGPGGERAAEQPSFVALRSGDAPDGARLEEYPQLGVAITPHASIANLMWIAGPDRVRSATASQRVTLPRFLSGGGISVGYDLSSMLSWPEAFVRVSGALYAGWGENSMARFIPVELTFEKGFYLGRRLSLFVAPGAVVQVNILKIHYDAVIDPTRELELSATTIGPSARLGLDVMLHPDWSLRLEGVARAPLTTASYELNGVPLRDYVSQRQDHFATIGGSLGLAKTF